MGDLSLPVGLTNDVSVVLADVFEKHPWSKKCELAVRTQHIIFVRKAIEVVDSVLGDDVGKIKFLRFHSRAKKIRIYISVDGVGHSYGDRGRYSFLMDELDFIEQESGELGELVDLSFMDGLNENEVDDLGDLGKLGDFSKKLQGPVPSVVKKPTVSLLQDGVLDVFDRLMDCSDHDKRSVLKAMRHHIKDSARRSKPLSLVDGVELVGADWFDTYPNFQEFAEYVRGHVALARLGDSAFWVQPALLVGPPGVGKTTFLRRLAQWVAADFYVQNAAALQSGSTFAGSDIFWRNSRPGLVFDALVFGDTANPIIVVDELDKVFGSASSGSGNVDGGNVLGALYELLEPATAESFEDRSLPGIKINAKHVVWFATANDVSAIDPAMLSRFRVFNIQAPNSAQMRVIVESIYSDLRSGHSWGSRFSDSLDQEFLNVMGTRYPRDVRKALESAFGRAALSGRTRLEIDDIPAEPLVPRVGFV